MFRSSASRIWRGGFAAMWTLILFGWSPAAAVADAFKRPIPKMELGDGDAVVFLGDSITHQCLYTQYVETYFYTRYPTRRIRFYNAGIGGDKCGDALLRFDEVAGQKPKYVTVLLGMNDGQYQPFNQEIFATYERDARRLISRIEEIKAIPILMTPTMFDRRAADIVNANRIASGGKPGPWPPRVLQYNAVLAHYGRFLQELAYDGGYGFVDMFGPLNRITMRERKTDPKFTLIADAVHPGPDGQAVMACAILEDMHPNRLVSAIRIAIDGDRMAATAQGGRISEARQEAGGVRFTFAAEALPWALPEKAAIGDRLANAGRRFSLERLVAIGLKPGKYSLKIAGETAGEYDHVAFASGIELQRNRQTPQYRQAARVAELNRVRNESVVVPLRNQWLATRELRNARKALAGKPGDEALTKRVQELEAKHANAGQKISELLAKSRSMEDEIYRANKPQPLTYEIVPAAAAP